MYKSADGGLTWKQISGNGLPAGEWGRVGIAIARSDSRRVYALIDAREGKSGLYRSDDGGDNWSLVGTDSRIHSRAWYFSEIVVDPKNPDVVYAPNVALYRSIDGGRTFVAIKGAPGGDDYHSLWVDPENPQRMIFGSDQGAAISVDGGATWSSWYNQPTAQFYHVAVDNQFPYRVYGAQQDSGTASVASRSDYGSITFRDWHPIGAEESGYIAPDPRDPNIVYGGGPYGGAFRFDLRTGQTQTISPSPAENFGAEISQRHYRFTWTSPLVFSPQDPQVLYLGAQMVLKTTDGGTSWSEMSPDLTGCDPAQANAAPDVKPTIETAKARCYGVIYTLAPSPKDANLMWAGSDTGLVQITRDGGKTWSNVTPPGLSDWSKITLIEVSPTDAASAYAAVDRHRLDDVNPYIYRTRDYGKTWTKIIEGISAPAFVNVLREDPARKGLVFAGTETGIYVSFDAGDHWQSLQLNLPTASIRDLVIHGDDLVVATHGRSFWILDDITPLRQIGRQIAAADAHLFQPQTAIRLRRSENSDTPLPPELPAGENPPTGAVIDYLLKATPADAITLEILDGAGKLIRKFSSSEQPPRPEKPPAIADYWFKPPAPLGHKAGMNRFVWDLRYPPPPTIETSYSISSIYGQDAIREPEGPLALPGNYQVRLTFAGKTHAQPLVVKMDPRVGTSAADLQRQFELDSRIASALERDTVAYREVKKAQARAQQPATSKEFQTLAAELAALAGDSDPDSNKHVALKKLNGQLASLETAVESADRAPTAQAQSTFERLSAELEGYLKQWEALRPRLEQLLPSTPRP